MDDTTKVNVSVKKEIMSLSKSELDDDSVKENDATEQGNLVQNGTANSSREDISEEDTMMEKSKMIKITKITKSAKTTPVKENTKNTTVSTDKKTPESSSKLHIIYSSPSSSSLSEDFYGFQEPNDSDEQIRKKQAFDKFLCNLEDVGERGADSEGEREKETMTVEDTDAPDSDSNQMEIDEGDSHPDSTEFSDKNKKKRTKDTDVEVMETDSVKSAEDPLKTEDEGVKVAARTTESHANVEYCGTCSEVVDDAEEGICCDGKCERWFHLQCSGLTQAEYDELGLDENAKWACSRCSGKPPPEIKPGSKPLLTVRKDLTTTPSPKRKMTSKEEKRPRVDISNPIFLKPFDYGWKRELVYRSTLDNQNKRQGDVYYYTPKGKKLRSLREISEHLLGTDLTVDNFTFWKDALGCDPDKEIIRDAKIKLANKDLSATPSPAAKKVAVAKTPKTPKTTPKLTATVTPLDSASGLPVAKASASVTPRVVLKTGKTGSISTGPKFKVTPSKTTTPTGQTQKLVISKGDEQTTDNLEPKMIGATGNDRRSRYDERCAVKEKNKVTEKSLRSVVDDNEKEGEDMEILPKNKFRRYGLLANRISTRNIGRKRRSKSNSSSSSSGSDELTNEQVMKPSLKSQLNRMKSVGSKEQRNESNVGILPFSTSFYNIPSNLPLPTETDILSSPNVKRPRSPEIQFRPSDPSSYGCQTNVLPTCRPNGPSISSFQNPFETVLIVDTSPPETLVNSPKCRPVLQNSPSHTPWTQDCAIKVISVETLRSRDGFSSEGYLVPSPSRQTSLAKKKQNTFIKAVEGTRNSSSLAKNRDKCSPVSVGSSSDVVVIEDLEDDSCPPFLVRNSPPPRHRRSTISLNHSPPSLQANEPQPLLNQQSLRSCPAHQISPGRNPSILTITPAGNSTTSLEPSECGSKYDILRKLKKERFYERRKARREMERLRKQLLKRKSEEKRLQIQYLQLKVLKLSQIKRKKDQE